MWSAQRAEVTPAPPPPRVVSCIAPQSSACLTKDVTSLWHQLSVAACRDGLFAATLEFCAESPKLLSRASWSAVRKNEGNVPEGGGCPGSPGFGRVDAHAVSMVAGLAFSARPWGGRSGCENGSPNCSAARLRLSLRIIASLCLVPATQLLLFDLIIVSARIFELAVVETAGHRLPIALDPRPTSKLRAFLTV